MDSIKKLKDDIRGLTIVELMLVTGISALIIVAVTGFMLHFYGGIIATNTESRLAVESQAILQNVVEELRVSSGVRDTNTINDPNAPGGVWTTSNDNLILIISSPALTSENEFVTNPETGSPYQNELVYFAEGETLYKRTLANPNVSDNTKTTTCPKAAATSDCSADVEMTESFEDMNFVFYDQDDNETAVLPAARSIELIIDMGKSSFGRDITFNNAVRVTLRNTTL